MKFYICRTCGNIIAYAEASGVPVVCCGKPMEELVPGTVDASHEKHIPVVAREGNKVTVTVGSVEHPMTEEHFIKWVVLVTCCGEQRRLLAAGDAPKAEFFLKEGEQVKECYAYCNLHGLWKA